MAMAQHRETRGAADWLVASGVLLSSWVAVAALTLQPTIDSDIVAVAFPPWWDAERTVLASASAGADIVRTGAIPTILVVRPAGLDGLARLRTAGAWLAMDPKAIEGCLNRLTKET